MKGRDLVGIAQTGTGKTAAFALPILNRLIADPCAAGAGRGRVLVLSPTRELASQIARELSRSFGRSAPRYRRRLRRCAARGADPGAGARPRRAGGDAGTSARSSSEARVCILSPSNSSSSTKSTRCSISASSSRFAASCAICRGSGRTWFFSATMPPDIPPARRGTAERSARNFGAPARHDRRSRRADRRPR